MPLLDRDQRDYGDRARLAVTNELKEIEWQELMGFPELANHPLSIESMQKLARKNAMAVLVASAAYTRKGERQENGQLHWRVVGGLIAPVFIGNHRRDGDIDRGRFDGQTVCEPWELVADEHEVDETFVMGSLLDGLILCREEMQFDAIRLVVNLRDSDFIDLLTQLGFQKGTKSNRKISMIHLG